MTTDPNPTQVTDVTSVRRELEEYRDALVEWLSTCKKENNPQGWADRERELEYINRSIARLTR
jgi:hypothetical protein